MDVLFMCPFYVCAFYVPFMCQFGLAYPPDANLPYNCR